MPWYDYLASGLAGAGRGWQEASRYQEEQRLRKEEMEERKKARELSEWIARQENAMQKEKLEFDRGEAAGGSARFIASNAPVGTFIPRSDANRRMVERPELSPFIEDTSSQISMLPISDPWVRGSGAARTQWSPRRQDPRSLASTPDELMTPTLKGWTTMDQPEDVKLRVAQIRAIQDAARWANRNANEAAKWAAGEKRWQAELGVTRERINLYQQQLDDTRLRGMRTADDLERYRQMSMLQDRLKAILQERAKVGILASPEQLDAWGTAEAELERQINVLRSTSSINPVGPMQPISNHSTTTVDPVVDEYFSTFGINRR